ncbi:MAG TPA: AAA family ATPase [Ktedonobacteraceae bacterium]|nr:AAA family ATPase [Ktedonobacteraceae bacterium]
MKLRKLKIQHFKNLQNFEIDFGEHSFRTVLLGQNGTGKSNLLEALIIIFRDLDLGAAPTFAYVLDYECRGNEIHIDADLARDRREYMQITIRRHDGLPERISYNRFAKDSERIYLPGYVFGYYSGPSDRMERHFDVHQNRFYQDQLKGEESQRFLFYARNIQSQFVLLAFFTEDEQDRSDDGQSARSFLDELLGIEKLISVLFVLHEPPWNSKEGDPRFWNARGTLGKFMGHLYDASLAPMRDKVRITPEFASKTTLEHLYCYLPDEQALRKLFKNYGNQREFFKALESTYISKILGEVRIRLKMRNAEELITFQDFSEGEQQLLMVLGLLRFTREDEALFFLDEPDTHLNPNWSVRYLDFMQRVVGDQPTSQVIMTTHNPLVIAGLQKEEVRVMQRNGADGEIFAEQPSENPRGMGVAGILTSELFGLRSALDLPTQHMIDEQIDLAVKEQLTQVEQQRLGELTDQLDKLGFATTEDDPLYAEFLRRFVRREDPSVRQQVTLTPDQQRERARLIDDILSEMIAEGRL